MSLTKDGEKLITLARNVVGAADAFATGAKTEGNDAGWIRIAAPVGVMRDVLAPLCAAFTREHPSVRLDLRASSDVVDLAKEGIDLAIRSDSLVRAPGHVRTPWFEFPWVICASPGYLKGRKLPKNPDELAGHALVGFRNPRTGRIRAWGFRHGVQVDPDATVVFDDGAAGWRAVFEGIGIGAVPLYLAADALRDGSVIELLEPHRDANAGLSLLRPGGRHTPARVKTLIAFLRAHRPQLGDLL